MRKEKAAVLSRPTPVESCAHPGLIDLFSSGRLTLRPSLEGRRLETALIRLLETD